MKSRPEDKFLKYPDSWFYDFVHKNGGEIISFEPHQNGKKSQRRRIKYKCAYGHIREVYAATLQLGNWCQVCARIKHQEKVKSKIFEKLDAIALERNGKILSRRDEYAGNGGKLRIKCFSHGEFKMSPQLLYRGKWCSKCKFEKLNKCHRRPWHEVIDLIENSGWGLITTEHEYINSDKIKVSCPDGHISIRPLYKIASGVGCAQCRSKRGEKMCRVTIEKIFGGFFPTKKPKFLETSNGSRLELDGYNEELKIAFEYQGAQHYEMRHFNGSKEKLLLLQARDIRKAAVCKDQGITLIVIPEFKADELYDSTKVINQIEAAIQNASLTIPEWKREGFDPVRKTNSKGEIDKWRGIGAGLNLDLLDTIWKGTKYKYLWRCCVCKYEWRAVVGARNRGSGCPQCGIIKRSFSRRSYAIGDLQQYASERYGICLSVEYKGTGYRYAWQCQNGHKWETNWGTMTLQKTWCPLCSRKNRKR